MGRVSFGGAQDNSQLFATLYAQYEDRLETLAERSAARAEEAQAAKDADVIDRWQQGEMSDEQFLAYAEGRIKETKGEDPTQNSYWKRVLRDAEKSILSEKISDTAEDIMDRIEAGKASWNDLKDFYARQRRSLRPNDPLYKQISDQMEEIDDRIAQNAVEGAFARVDYLFRDGQLTGTQAGAQLRSLAQQFRQNDPARYWQILAQAADLERYGSGTYGSGGGSGGSGSSASRSANLNALIDALEGQKYRIDSVSKQFEKGETTGTFTYETENGKLVTEEVLLRNPDGTPSAAMQALDDAQLANFDRLIKAYDRKGDRSQRDLRIQDKAEYIENQIQPRNTIGPEQQGNHLLSTLHEAIRAAGNGNNPLLDWNKVRRIAARVQRWHGKLNTTLLNKTEGGVRGGLKEGVEIAPTEYREESAAEDRTTAEFTERANALAQWADAVANAQTPDEVAGAQGLLATVLGNEFTAGEITASAQVAVDLVTGIPEGRYVRAYVPGEGLVYTPVGQTVQTIAGPNGPQAVPTMQPVDREGNPLWDAAAGESGHLIMAEINGAVEPVWAVAESAFFIGGQRVTPQQYAQYSARLATADTEDEVDAIVADFGTSDPAKEYQQMVIPSETGTAQTWYFDPTAREGQGGWFKNRVTKYGGVPVPFAGVNGRKAQAMVDQMTKPDGTPIDPTGRAYFNATVVNARENQALSRSDWYMNSQEASRNEHRMAQRQQLAQGFLNERFAGAGADESSALGVSPQIGQILSQAAKQVGVSLTPPTRSSMGTRMPEGLDAGRFGGPNLTPVKPVNVTPPRITLPKINLPRISMNPGSSVASQLQVGQNLTEGFGNARYRLP